MHNGYAVIDLETTGLAPSYGHRIIEIGIVHVTPDGEVEQTFETVVNPNRDLGPVHIHRLRGADMDGAPSFADVAGDLADRLQGRVVVAHNASFEARFLHAEFERLQRLRHRPGRRARGARRRTRHRSPARRLHRLVAT